MKSVTKIDDGARLRVAVALLLVSQAVMLGGIFSTYLVPWPYAGFLCCGLYAVLWWAEARVGIRSPITRLLTVFYAMVLAVRLAGVDPALLAYLPALIYALLACLTLGMLAMGQPFVAAYSSGAGFYPLQWTLAVMWGCLHLLSALAAWLLSPSMAFMLVPMGLMAIGSIGTIWLSFYGMGPRFDRQHVFEMSGMAFREVTSANDRACFYQLVADAYRTDLQRALGSRKQLSLETITKEQLASDAKHESALLRFLAFEGTRAVGAICIYFDHPEHGLPIESESKLNFAAHRRRTRIAEVGKLAIVRTHRMNQVLLKGLFKCAVEAAAQRFVSIIFNDAFAFQQRLYEKIGFMPLLSAPYVAGEEQSTGYGLEVMPMAMDLEKMVGLDESTVTSVDMRGQLNPYVMERFFKRITLRRLVWRRDFDALEMAT